MFNVKFAIKLSVIEMSQQLFYTLGDNYAECPAVLYHSVKMRISGYIYVILSYSSLAAKTDILNLQNVEHFAHIFATFHLWLPRPGPDLTAGDFKPQPLPSRSLAQAGDKWRKLSRLPDIFQSRVTFSWSGLPHPGTGLMLVKILVLINPNFGSITSNVNLSDDPNWRGEDCY